MEKGNVLSCLKQTGGHGGEEHTQPLEDEVVAPSDSGYVANSVGGQKTINALKVKR